MSSIPYIEEPLFHFPHRILSSQTNALGILYRADYLSRMVTLSDEHDHCAWIALDNHDLTDFFAPDWEPAIRRIQSLA